MMGITANNFFTSIWIFAIDEAKLEELIGVGEPPSSGTIGWCMTAGWQVIKSAREFRFLPPKRIVMRRARGPGMRWAA